MELEGERRGESVVKLGTLVERGGTGGREGGMKGNARYTSERELKQHARPVPTPVFGLVEKYILPLARLDTDDLLTR